jgi:low temperature requirement protein LtrA
MVHDGGSPRPHDPRHSLLIITAVAFWIGSMHVHWPNQLALIFIGIVIDLFGGLVLIAIMRTTTKEHGFGRWSRKWFEFFPAINIEHRVERNNAFVALVFGYSILTILYQSHSAFGINAFFGKGVLGLIQAFAFNW